MSDSVLIDRIYESAAVAELWPAVLCDLARTVDGAGALLVTRRSDAWLGWRVSPSYEASVSAYLRSEAALGSQSTPRLLAANRAGFVADHELFSDDEYMADPSMTECGTPNGLHHAAATAIQTPSHDLAIVHVQRRAGLSQFSASDLQRLDTFRPHLARAALLAARWRLAKLHAAAQALELIGLPAVVLDESGRVLVTNALIESLTHQIVWLPNNRLAFVDPAATKLLRQGVDGLGDSMVCTPRSFPVRDPVGGEGAVAHLLPIRGQARDLFDSGLGVLLITALGAKGQRTPEWITGLFDLTVAEARVATGLLQGLNVDAIARLHGVARETVRSQVKAVLSKTGCQRHTQFVAKFQPVLGLL